MTSVNCNFTPNWLISYPCIIPDVGSSLALGFYYCSDHMCTLCQNSVAFMDLFMMLLCGFYWYFRSSICILAFIFNYYSALHVVYRVFMLPGVIKLVHIQLVRSTG